MLPRPPKTSGLLYEGTVSGQNHAQVVMTGAKRGEGKKVFFVAGCTYLPLHSDFASFPKGWSNGTAVHVPRDFLVRTLISFF